MDDYTFGCTVEIYLALKEKNRVSYHVQIPSNIIPELFLGGMTPNNLRSGRYNLMYDNLSFVGFTNSKHRGPNRIYSLEDTNNCKIHRTLLDMAEKHYFSSNKLTDYDTEYAHNIKSR